MLEGKGTFCRCGQQHCDLPGLLFSAALMPDFWKRGIHAAVVGSVAAESGFRDGGTIDDGAGAVRKMTNEMELAEELAELKARYERVNSLYQVGNVIHSTLDSQEALQLILAEAVRLMRASSGSVVLINPTTGFLEILASKGLPEKAAELRLRVGEGITGWVARAGKAARIGDVSRDLRYIMIRPDVRSELAVPLEVNGEVRGVLNVDSERRDAFTANDQELLEAFTIQTTKVIHNT